MDCTVPVAGRNMSKKQMGVKWKSACFLTWQEQGYLLRSRVFHGVCWKWAYHRVTRQQHHILIVFERKKRLYIIESSVETNQRIAYSFEKSWFCMWIYPYAAGLLVNFYLHSLNAYLVSVMQPFFPISFCVYYSFPSICWKSSLEFCSGIRGRRYREIS